MSATDDVNNNSDEKTRDTVCEREQLQPFPSPQISDLLILTLSVSFVFALVTPGYQDEARLYTIGWRDLLPVLLDDFVKSLCLFGLIVFLRQAFRCSRFRIEPGHVALLAMAPYEIVTLIFNVFYPILELHRPAFMHVMQYAVYGCLYAASLIYPLLTIRKLDLRWQVPLYLLTATIAVASLSCLTDAAIDLGSLSRFYRRHVYATIGNLDALIILATCVAIAIDWSQRQRRDWLHTIGVLVVLMHPIAALMHWERTMRLWWQWLLSHLLP